MSSGKYKSEAELDKGRRVHDYNIEIIVKYTILAAAIALITFIVILFIYTCITDKVFQKQVLDILKDNLNGIIFTCISILGLNKYLRK